jgi:hypothetical protein
MMMSVTGYGRRVVARIDPGTLTASLIYDCANSAIFYEKSGMCGLMQLKMVAR